MSGLWAEDDDEAQAHEQWQYEVGTGETLLGFQEWLFYREEAKHDPHG